MGPAVKTTNWIGQFSNNCNRINYRPCKWGTGLNCPPPLPCTTVLSVHTTLLISASETWWRLAFGGLIIRPRSIAKLSRSNRKICSRVTPLYSLKSSQQQQQEQFYCFPINTRVPNVLIKHSTFYGRNRGLIWWSVPLYYGLCKWDQKEIPFCVGTLTSLDYLSTQRADFHGERNHFHAAQPPQR